MAGGTTLLIQYSDPWIELALLFAVTTSKSIYIVNLENVFIVRNQRDPNGGLTGTGVFYEPELPSDLFSAIKKSCSLLPIFSQL